MYVIKIFIVKFLNNNGIESIKLYMYDIFILKFYYFEFLNNIIVE